MSEQMTDRSLRDAGQLDGVVFGEDGLVPVVAQDAGAGQTLMVAWANREALERSLATGQLHFWSRSRQSLWRKGETSGNMLKLRSLHSDCDGDTVLALVEPSGPACHTGERSCFGRNSDPSGTRAAPTAEEAWSERPVHVLDVLWEVIVERARELPEGSYTTRLLTDRNLRLKKLGEETAELILALTEGDPERVSEEAADLIYHVLVAIQAAGSSLAKVRAELASRR